MLLVGTPEAHASNKSNQISTLRFEKSPRPGDVGDRTYLRHG